LIAVTDSEMGVEIGWRKGMCSSKKRWIDQIEHSISQKPLFLLIKSQPGPPPEAHPLPIALHLRLLGCSGTCFGGFWAHHPSERHGNGLPKSQGTLSDTFLVIPPC
jgi:hypothetical protein